MNVRNVAPLVLRPPPFVSDIKKVRPLLCAVKPDQEECSDR